ncbi:preprotein translocase subunit SecF [Candidatus Kinetoplastibacterium blastocrithidii TCC012E]|uniref:Protein-export membrane protein SecF n=1 Tax=Candidatus Kinetoplastidibacterium blastocrithidiae TCC012E TaxID=1208922 RepID=M1MCP6_9PROT|nr:protein translocase subunit SecF [Candidatus Kinetoplastibacterium blastocrithidii]AFZ83469.1 preprotein translocase subunit SecF [Candidatus Kinetoplastibacterium blastocrithidii (ex Strigomonas culicis)]AGF49565.1 preprotein translocase subunit SecF [Candidatus Kinetoplastibacterium blastocrithidii TCC012E]
MEFFRINKTIPFMKYSLALNLISLMTFMVSVFFIATKGLNLSTEFTGGTTIEMSFSGENKISIDDISETICKIGYTDYQVQIFDSLREIMIRLPILSKESALNERTNNLLLDLKNYDSSLQITRIETVGPQVGNELIIDGILALITVVIGVVIYLTIRFEYKLALSGIIANLHDIVIILGFFAFFQWEFSLCVLAGILAVLGYSVNESVIVMDRIRENINHLSRNNINIVEIINMSITQTVSRTIITHGCTQLMVLSMLIFGGQTLHYFSIALTIGIWFGIYSSVFVASSLAMWMRFGNKNLHSKAKNY